MSSLKISASSLLKNHYLTLDSGGVKYYESAGIGGAKRFGFSDIACVLLALDNTLSFQVGDQVYSIATDPNNHKHQALIAALVQELEKTTQHTQEPGSTPFSDASAGGQAT